MNIVCPSVRTSPGSLGHYSRQCATGAHFGSAFVHSHTLDSGRTNERTVAPLYTEPKNLFSLCRRRFRMWLHRMRDQTTLFEGTEPRRGRARVMVGLGLDFALFHYQGIFLVQKSGRSHLCLYRELNLHCVQRFFSLGQRVLKYERHETGKLLTRSLTMRSAINTMECKRF